MSEPLARTCIACNPLASLTGSPSHEPTQSPTFGSLPRITRLSGVCPNGAIPNAYTAAQNAIFASVRANSSGEKFARAPTKSTPGIPQANLFERRSGHSHYVEFGEDAPHRLSPCYDTGGGKHRSREVQREFGWRHPNSFANASPLDDKRHCFLALGAPSTLHRERNANVWPQRAESIPFEA